MIEIRMKFPLVAVFERVIFFESKMCQMFQSIYIDNICILLTYKKKRVTHTFVEFIGKLSIIWSIWESHGSMNGIRRTPEKYIKT